MAGTIRRETADLWQQSSRLVSKLRRARELDDTSLERLVERHRELHRWTGRLLQQSDGALPLVLIEAAENLNTAVDLFAERGLPVSDDL